MKIRHIVSGLFGLLLAACATGEKIGYSWEEDLHHRLLCDFTQSREQVLEYITKYIPEVTDSQMAVWEAKKELEYMVIDSQKLYFRNAASNLFLINEECGAIRSKINGPQGESNTTFACKNNIREIIPTVLAKSNKLDAYTAPKRMRIIYTLTIKPDAVPEGELIRCWLPFPRKDIPRQQDVKLLATSEQEYQFSDPKCAHSTIYMEKKAEAGKPTIFSESFEYTSFGAYFNLTEQDIQPYDTNSPLYKEYTAEREKHIVFTPRLRELADSLTAGLKTPLEKARALFRWVNDGFPWASAREYSTIENIPMYVLENKHGDCGQVTLLFVTLCRICGIPAHFQSGFMMHPKAWNLHDWGEIYFEGVGWVPVDQSFGIPTYAENQREEWFYLGGIDSWRMIVNSDYGKELSPQKTYPRSETVDFQRGEVEWEGGNIYFDQWDYDMDIEYLDD